MSDITEFPDLTEVLAAGDNLQTFKASGEIKAGQVVAYKPGNSEQVTAGTDTDGEFTAGVAVFGAQDGGTVTVASYGTIATVVNADDSTSIDAGAPIKQASNDVGGTVEEISTDSTGDETVKVHNNGVGFLIDNLSGGGTARAFVMPITITQPNSS